MSETTDATADGSADRLAWWYPRKTRPDADDDRATTGEDDKTIIDVLANDKNATGVVAVNGCWLKPGGEGVTLASGALVTLGLDGKLVYDPHGRFERLNDGEKALDTFSYTVAGKNGYDTAKVQVTVDGVTDDPVGNRPPVAVSDVKLVPYDYYPVPEPYPEPYPLPKPELSSASELEAGSSKDLIITTLAIGEEGDPDPFPKSVRIDVLANDSDPDPGDKLTIGKINGNEVSIGDSVKLKSGATVTVTEGADGQEVLIYKGGVLGHGGGYPLESGATTLELAAAGDTGETELVPIDPLPYPYPIQADSFTYQAADQDGALSNVAEVTVAHGFIIYPLGTASEPPPADGILIA
jgi:hypothetical protein